MRSVVRAAARDVVYRDYTRVGVVAWAFTIKSQCYDTLVDELDPDIAIRGEPRERLTS